MNEHRELITGSFFIVPLGNEWNVSFFPETQSEYCGVGTTMSKFELLHFLRMLKASAEDIDKVEKVEDDPDASYTIDVKLTAELNTLKRLRLLSKRTPAPSVEETANDSN